MQGTPESVLRGFRRGSQQPGRALCEGQKDETGWGLLELRRKGECPGQARASAQRVRCIREWCVTSCSGIWHKTWEEMERGKTEEKGREHMGKSY